MRSKHRCSDPGWRKGTRLHSVIQDRPKPMAEVLGRPFLEWLICDLKRQGILRIILAVGYKSELIQAHFADGQAWGVEIIYSDEDTPLDTGGAVRNALDLIAAENVLVLNGDSFSPFDVGALVNIQD